MKVFLVLATLALVRAHPTSSLLEGILAVNYSSTAASEWCQGDLQIVEDALRAQDIWAMKLLDASGRIESGFVWGNNFWLGSKSSCARLARPYPVSLSARFSRNNVPHLTDIAAPIPVIYRVIYVRHSSRLQLDMKILDLSVLHIGLCLPTNCSNNDTEILVTQLLADVNSAASEILGKNATVLHSKSLQLRDTFYRNPLVISSIVLLAIMVSLSAVCSLYNLLMCRGAQDDCQINKEDSRSLNIFEKFITCFSIHHNAVIVFNHELGKSSVPVIHGLRALTMFWIITGHIFFYALASTKNFQRVLTYTKEWFMQPFNAAATGVDTFFVISGFLLAYLYFESYMKKPKKDGVIAFCKSVFSRVLRIAPSYYTILLFSIIIGIYLKDKSQFHLLENIEENCTKYWWRNVLFINNFFPFSEICLTWSWYLSVDLQCFIITTLCLVIWSRSQRLATALFIVIFLTATFFNSYLGYVLNFDFKYDVEFNSIDFLYTPVWSRIPVYFCGVLAGWFLSTFNRKLYLKRSIIHGCWLLTACTAILLIFGRMLNHLPAVASMWYCGFGKTAWAMGISWIIIACATGHGGK
ncbi:nose resistant to fluoxetine protein 6-like [Phlebotomus argentipes]|uniref:nose resistant to fluoxetine protein 6-like n=1 Tax=Phlebotomus argentipes TaxID=94469 RepID=UPI00289336B9|nr:nose resistant to fluoxetine protein 6-like [Phlebotomus argentipes]